MHTKIKETLSILNYEQTQLVMRLQALEQERTNLTTAIIESRGAIKQLEALLKIEEIKK